MQEELITFKTAVLAKEKGFDIPTQKAYIEEESFTNFEESFGESDFYFDANDFYENWNEKGWVFNKDGNKCFGCKLDNIRFFEAYSAPTQSLVQKWLREKHSIFVEVTTDLNVGILFTYRISKLEKYYVYHHDLKTTFYSSYEEALEEGLFEALKLLPDAKNK